MSELFTNVLSWVPCSSILSLSDKLFTNVLSCNFDQVLPLKCYFCNLPITSNCNPFKTHLLLCPFYEYDSNLSRRQSHISDTSSGCWTASCRKYRTFLWRQSLLSSTQSYLQDRKRNWDIAYCILFTIQCSMKRSMWNLPAPFVTQIKQWYQLPTMFSIHILALLFIEISKLQCSFVANCPSLRGTSLLWTQKIRVILSCVLFATICKCRI